ncbi:hypothetical protein [Paractinoplanes brasiliensis]|uniref:Uncharacterized protein n=1 Tax=Paractinoplanes brasiliensis TaxID=52695 RepID=A0A4R6J9G0_9ACTN|nr:hypothetical protein [Actinoplanes brasiliensis]TDO32283.1 hypothetical protein C8E87_7739 [Actinoplanes brasiliensis]GID27849.1 hypothetical protein Abr02nite_28320 [Actinoplanes brasiliensis]
MDDDRSLNHLSFPTFLQTHVNRGPSDRIEKGRRFERYIKENALRSRGLVIPDSDLNNNGFFYPTSAEPMEIFWTALSTGFIRRGARRTTDQRILSQIEVAEGLKKSSPERYGRISQDYLNRLDATIERYESAGSRGPLVWDHAKVMRISGQRLLSLLRHPNNIRGKSVAERRLMDRYEDWTIGKLRSGAPFGAADLESELKSSVDPTVWNAVWPIALEAHAGNIPMAFGGGLATLGLPAAKDRLIPAGPESDVTESRAEALFYGRPDVSGANGDVELEIRHPRTSRSENFSINYAVLDDLTLPQIEEIRETAEPDEFLDCRFQAAASGERNADLNERLEALALEYHARLVKSGVMLTERAERNAIVEELDARRIIGPPSSGKSLEVRVKVQLERQVEVNYIMQAISPFPLLGTQHVLCDIQRLREVMEPGVYDRLHATHHHHWILKRPDYRVVEALAGVDE